MALQKHMENTSSYLSKELVQVEEKIQEAKAILKKELSLTISQSQEEPFYGQEQNLIEKEIREVEEEEEDEQDDNGEDQTEGDDIDDVDENMQSEYGKSQQALYIGSEESDVATVVLGQEELRAKYKNKYEEFNSSETVKSNQTITNRPKSQ